MTNTILYNKISALPQSIQNEIIDYMEFLIQKYNQQISKIHPKAGCMKGIFKMEPDFDEPLEDFSEYLK